MLYIRCHCWEAGLLDGSEDAVEAKLTVDVCLELLAVDGLRDGVGSGTVADVLASLRERHYGRCVVVRDEV